MQVIQLHKREAAERLSIRTQNNSCATPGGYERRHEKVRSSNPPRPLTVPRHEWSDEEGGRPNNHDHVKEQDRHLIGHNEKMLSNGARGRAWIEKNRWKSCQE